MSGGGGRPATTTSRAATVRACVRGERCTRAAAAVGERTRLERVGTPTTTDRALPP